jgi:hypothetical protein
VLCGGGGGGGVSTSGIDGAAAGPGYAIIEFFT